MKTNTEELSTIGYEISQYDREHLLIGSTIEWTFAGQKKKGHTDGFDGDFRTDELERYVLSNATEI